MPSKPPRLTILAEPELTPAEKVLSRLKKIPRPAGMLQCPRCGGREVFTSRAGVIVKEGKVKERGSVIVKDGCLLCAKSGHAVTMVPGGQGPKLVR